MRLSRLILPALLLALPIAAHADELLFTLTGPETGSFILSSTPTPLVYSTGNYTEIAGTEITGVPGQFAQINFYNESGAGGFNDDVDGDGYAGGQSLMYQVYSGTEAAPIFAPGVYHFYDYDTGAPGETLTVTSTPEPSSLVLLGTGVLGMAGAVRRRLSK